MARDSAMWQELGCEIKQAQAKYGHFHSTHEAYGVLAEEVAELLDAIRSNFANDIDEEAMQVAAVAIRLVQACRMRGPAGAEFARRSGFGGGTENDG
jgi:NTP pyrophosphatase (non-canonical NTP hydrolase)